MFISKKKWNLIEEDIFELQDNVFALEYNLNKYKEVIMADEKAKAKNRHPSSLKNTTKKVDKNGK